METLKFNLVNQFQDSQFLNYFTLLQFVIAGIKRIFPLEIVVAKVEKKIATLRAL